MPKDKVRAAVIGVGLIGQNHARFYNGYERSKVVCVADVNEERARSVAQQYGCDYVTDYHDLAKMDIDVVSVATPDFAHFDPVMTALKSGKHVLCEKPLTTNLAEAQQMVSTARANGLVLSVNLGNRYQAEHVGMKQAIDKGEIGKPVMGYFRLADTIYVPTEMLSWAGKSGPHWFLFSHTYDLIRWFLGEDAKTVYARGTKQVLVSKGIDAYDVVQALVTFESGCFVTFETSWIVPNAFPGIVDKTMTLYGTNGRIERSYNGADFFYTTEKHVFGASKNSRQVHGQPAGPESIRNFVDAVADGKEPLVKAEDGLAVVAMISAVERSIAEGRPVEVASLLKEVQAVG